ncbi:MAG: hypothetical protein E7265_05725 [Lachnospiraceae bacterium]|nr:hypothetical protein [Lachnospiraceae bacterium]
MNKQKWFESVNLIDDKYIDEAYSTHNKKRPVNIFRISLIAACACILLTLGNIWLFAPFYRMPDVSKYSDSEYYSIIKKLNTYTYSKPKYNNNFEKILYSLSSPKESKKKYSFGGIMNDFFNGSVEGESPDFPSNIKDVTYEETTDNQVDGVIEADLIKRTSKNIFYLDENILRVYSIAGENSVQISTYEIDTDNNESSSYYIYYDETEMYLTEDCKTLVLILPYYQEGEKRLVDIITLDISNPSSVSKKDVTTMYGSYISSRLKDGKLLVLTNYHVYKSDISYDDETTFIPQIITNGVSSGIPADDIMSPDKITSSAYTVISLLDLDNPAVNSYYAFLSYSKEIYISSDTIYATREYRSDNYLSTTEISTLSYADGILDPKGSVSVNGYINNQYSFDEYNDILRVVTTVETKNGSTSASLFCIDTATLQIVASVNEFAPEGDTVKSVRFDKDNAYVCTAVVVTFKDPVYFFDLSDLNNITYKDTGVIEGYSSSLVNFGNGHLLGIGLGSNSTIVKIEMYKEGENSVDSVCSYEKYAFISSEYKAYYIDRENQLLGLGLYDIKTDSTSYIVLLFDGYEFKEILNVPLNGDTCYMRGLYIDDYFYMFGQDDFKVQKLFN